MQWVTTGSRSLYTLAPSTRQWSTTTRTCLVQVCRPCSGHISWDRVYPTPISTWDSCHRIVPDRPFTWVDRWSIGKMDQPFYRRNERLIPFAHRPADCSDLCFDIFRPDTTGDYPIIKVWHGRLAAEADEWSDLDCERSQVFGGFSEYFEYLHEWLIYRAATPEPRFEDWLRTRGKKGPPRYYGEPC
jgi:hypothetical protein